MRPLGFAKPSGVSGPAAFVKTAGYAPIGGTTRAVSFSGTLEGDLAVVLISNSASANPPTPSGWTIVTNAVWVSHGYSVSIYSKVMSAADITAGSVTFTGLDAFDYLILSHFTRNVSVATMVGRVDDFDGNPVIPGFTKAGGSKAIITFCVSRDGPVGITKPAVTTSRIINLQSTNFISSADDIIPSSGYTNGATMTYGTGIDFAAIAWAVELT